MSSNSDILEIARKHQSQWTAEERKEIENLTPNERWRLKSIRGNKPVDDNSAD